MHESYPKFDLKSCTTKLWGLNSGSYFISLWRTGNELTLDLLSHDLKAVTIFSNQPFLLDDIPTELASWSQVEDAAPYNLADIIIANSFVKLPLLREGKLFLPGVGIFEGMKLGYPHAL
jgi:hypothetical protein